MDVNAMGLVDGYPHVHSPLYPNGYSPHEYHQLMQQQGDMHMQSSTCVPSLIPPGIDPAQVDMRTFYPYQPNEVKHRKRTTRPQLKVLEAVYVHDTKPNASMRKKLADELGMTPRGVQVWFQNRRAKEKNLARKAENGGDASKKPMNLTSDKKPSDRPPSPSSSSPTPVSNKSAQSNGSSHDMSVSPGRRASSPSHSPLPSSSPMIIPRISTSDVSDGQRPSGRTLSNPDEPLSSEFLRPIHSMSDIGAQRRASLPMNSLSPSASSPNLSALRAGLSPMSQRGLPPGFDPSRRGSVDTNMRRLNTHPYAHLAQHANRLYGGVTSPRTSQAFAFHSGLGLTAEGPSRLDSIPAGISGRMGMGIRHGSMPHILQHTRSSPPNDLSRSAQPFLGQSSRPMPQKSFPDGPRAPGASPRSLSMSSGSTMFTNPFAPNASSPPVAFDAPIPPDRPVSPSTTSPPPISQSFLHSHPSAMYAPMRSVQPPVPGPLPEPSFTFGFPSSSPSLSSASSPSDGSTILGVSNSGENDDARNADDCDDEGSAVSSNYDPASRFGSFASVGSETSWTTYWSDTGSQGTKQGPEGFDAERRGSFASYCLPELLGGLDVGGNANGTQQAFSDEHSAEHRQHLTATQIVEQRRGSASSHEQLVYATEAHDSYQDKNNVYDIPEEQSGYLGSDQGNYASQEQGAAYSPPGQDAYSPSSTISAGSQMPVDKGTPPGILPQSSSSELVYALQAPGDTGSSAKSGQFASPPSYPDAAANGSQNQQQFDSYHHVYDQQQAHYTFPHDQSHSGYNQGQQSVGYEYGPRSDTLGYPPDSVSMDPLCVPPPMGMHDGDYVQQYA